MVKLLVEDGSRAGSPGEAPHRERVVLASRHYPRGEQTEQADEPPVAPPFTG
jgi:hypothetical protein